MHRAVLLIFAVSVLLAPAGAVAQVQPGGTGGSVGKQDKSLSGGSAPTDAGSATKPHHIAAKPQSEESGNAKGSSCGRIVGTWKWGLGFLVVIRKDGTANHAYAGNGTWSCNDGQYVFVWPTVSITDHISLSTDGNSIAGSNSIGMTFSGARF
jgi:hypothetical protein